MFQDPDDDSDHIDNIQEISLGDGYCFKLSVSEDEFNNGKKSLFATHIWSGSIKLAEKLILHGESIQGKSVLEFGAAAGLPSLVCGRLGAQLICSSDYPSSSVMHNLEQNIVRNASCSEDNKDRAAPPHEVGTSFVMRPKHHTVEHIWGESVEPLLAVNQQLRYDVLVAAECIWKQSSHDVFIMSIINTITKGGHLFLSFSHHIPGREQDNYNFIDQLYKKGFSLTFEYCVPAKHMWTDRLVDMYIYVLCYDGCSAEGQM